MSSVSGNRFRLPNEVSQHRQYAGRATSSPTPHTLSVTMNMETTSPLSLAPINNQSVSTATLSGSLLHGQTLHDFVHAVLRYGGAGQAKITPSCEVPMGRNCWAAVNTTQSSYLVSQMEEILWTYTVDQIIAAVEPFVELTRNGKRSRTDLLHELDEAPEPVRRRIEESTAGKFGTKRKPKVAGVAPRRRVAKKNARRRTTTVRRGDIDDIDNAAAENPEEEIQPVDDIDAVINGAFLEAVSEDIVTECIERTIDRTGNDALRKGLCMVCARRLFLKDLEECSVDELPSKRLLKPFKEHPAHILTSGCLLHPRALAGASTYVCSQCMRKLKKYERPPFALANAMWIGDIPFQLAILTLPERLLIALYFPAAYVVKLYPKIKGAESWDKESVNSGMKGNVSTYRLNTAQIADMASGKTMPPSPQILAATIGVTFVGANNVPLRILPDFLRVRRHRVFQALVWLRQHNALYSEIEISAEQLELLPEDAVPDEITLNTRYSDDVNTLEREQAGYVPRDAADEAEERDYERGRQDVTMTTVGLPSGVTRMDDDQNESAVHGVSDVRMAFEEYEPIAFPLQPHGVVDAHAEGVPDSDLYAHALANTVERAVYQQDFGVRKSSAFVNEYARTDEHGQRFDGGPSNPNHMLGAFPTLFPYGVGGFEVDRDVKVAYEAHSRWALQYDDARFRKDFYFMFQAFGVLQKRQVCRSAGVQIKRSAFIANQVAFLKLKPQDLLTASAEETRKVPFSNPIVRKLRKQLTSVRARVAGTDESRISIRSQVWGMTLRFNPPTIWATLNLSDTGDPIAQVLAGQQIDLDRFVATAGPDSSARTVNIAGDPYAAAEFFHLFVGIILEEMFGITVRTRGTIKRRPGIVGIVNGYIGTVEAQARGTLHLHILFWLQGAPTAAGMKAALESETFRDKVKKFIKRNIRADIRGTDALSLLQMRKEANIAYSRPPDPRLPDYEVTSHELEAKVARAVQTHDCNTNTCLRTKGGRLVCKRRAPWPLSSEDWVLPNGDWGPRRVYGRMNAWNPALLQVTRSNQDMKLVTNGQETKDITFYITLYIAKKQIQASNASALLAKSLAMHDQLNKRQATCSDINKRMLQQCANTLSRQHEFSGPEVISYLMGWGDRFISHNYVSIYWDQVTAELRRAFPVLRNRSYLQNRATTMEQLPDSVPGEPEPEPTVQMRMVDGVFVLKDQPKEYSDRGHELEDMNFYDYFVKTYDGPLAGKKRATAPDGGQEDETDLVDDEEEGAGSDDDSHRRPSSRRVPYLASANRKRCRIIRGKAYETNLQFIGSWFPRSDKDDREYYCAQMLTLLSPWRDLTKLKGEDATFEATFATFLDSASARVKQTLENIQYFHECSDGTGKRKEGAADSGGFVQLDDEVRRAAELAELQSMQAPLSEADVEHARNNRYAAREYIYGAHAMAVAKATGIFKDVTEPVEIGPLAERASWSETLMYQEWGSKVNALTRGPNYVVDNRPPAPAPEDVLADVVASIQAPQQYTADVIPLDFAGRSGRARTAEQQAAVDMLNTEQRRAHDIIERHLERTLAGQPQEQLLMIVRGEGGTGKTVLLNAISHTFDYLQATQMLAKTATTGVAASLIGGQTVHSWAGLPVNAKDDPDWMSTASKATIEKRRRNILPAKYLEVDEFSMLTKKMLAQLSQVVGAVRAAAGEGTPTQPFGGLNVILFGDLHQFPPVGQSNSALYCETDKKLQPKLGLEIYRQFRTVVTLVEQKRMTDLPWMALLRRLREGACTEDDLKELKRLLVTDPLGQISSWDTPPWDKAVLVTPRHGSRMQWNTAALKRHCAQTGNRMYICTAEDTRGRRDEALTLRQRVTVAGMKTKQTGKLAERVELAVGMRAMVVLNLSTEGDLANGTRGEIIDIKLDSREELPPKIDTETGATLLRYPPAVVFFKSDTSSFKPFEGLPEGVLPIVPSRMGFTIDAEAKGTVTIHRRQLAITPGYAFTDYKSQGQTIEFVLVDLEKPPTSGLTPFNAYVALSRSRGRGTIRLLRGFETELFTTHPSQALAKEDVRLAELTFQTQRMHPVHR